MNEKIKRRNETGISYFKFEENLSTLHRQEVLMNFNENDRKTVTKQIPTHFYFCSVLLSCALALLLGLTTKHKKVHENAKKCAKFFLQSERVDRRFEEN